MKALLGQLWRLVLITALGFVGSLIAGLMVYGGSVFSPQSVGFAYVAYGLSGGFIFAFYHVRGLSNTIAAAVAVGAIQFAVSATWMPVVNAAVWAFGVNLSVVVLAFLFERKLAGFRHWKFTVVGLVYGGLFVVLTLIVALLTRIESMPPTLFQANFLDGLWIGLGLGIGVEAAESIMHSVDQHHAAALERRHDNF